jgi:enoyl-CoA hydratase
VSVVEVERRGPVAVITLNRPEVHNALNAEAIAALVDAVDDAAADPKARAVVLTGAGEKAFSAGADLKELASMGPDRAGQVLTAGQRALRAVELAPIPVVAAVNGLALGGGFELVLAATFPLFSTRASLGLPESGLGLMPGYGGTQRLPRSVGARVAAHLMLTGGRLTAERAYALGLSPLPPVEPTALVATALEAAERIAVQGPMAVRAILAALEQGRDAPLDAALAIETGLAALAVAGEESTEGIGAFLEHRPARFADPEVGR